MYEDRDQLLLVAREVVSVGLRVPAGEDRMLAALEAIVEHVAPSQMNTFWVALIEHTIETGRPFLAVYGDELTKSPKRDDQSGSAALALPLDLLNDALGHAGRGDYEAVADVVRLIAALGDDERTVGLGNCVHMALVLGELVRFHCSGDAAAS